MPIATLKLIDSYVYQYQISVNRIESVLVRTFGAQYGAFLFMSKQVPDPGLPLAHDFASRVVSMRVI